MTTRLIDLHRQEVTPPHARDIFSHIVALIVSLLIVSSSTLIVNASPSPNLVGATFNTIHGTPNSSNNSIVLIDTRNLNVIVDRLTIDTFQYGGSVVDIGRRLFYIKRNDILQEIDLSSKPMRMNRNIVLEYEPFELQFHQKRKKLYALFQAESQFVGEIDTNKGTIHKMIAVPRNRHIIRGGCTFDSRNGRMYIQSRDIVSGIVEIASYDMGNLEEGSRHSVYLKEPIHQLQYSPKTDTLYGIMNETLYCVSVMGDRVTPLVTLPQFKNLNFGTFNIIFGVYYCQIESQDKKSFNIAIDVHEKRIISQDRSFNSYLWMNYLPQQSQYRHYFSLLSMRN